ncbi:TIGR02117 family protein [Chromobacterium phragmitis]|uniref:TIGR02117 family protein n=1 Tax=Chromobacterium phragmitis TaxID=2202141 RepID=A0ABV0IQZ7_9NEIS
MRTPTTIFRLVLRSLLLIPALPLCYLLAALALGLLPSNREWAQPEAGIPIYLDSNGVHTSLVMPVKTAQADWTTAFSPRQLSKPERYAHSPYISISWGSKVFFLTIQSWKDLSAGKALSALAFDQSVLHVEYLPQPKEGKDTKRVLISPEQYEKLVAFIRRSAPFDDQGQALQEKGYHYYDNDAFYTAHGRYNPIVTCNQWTRDALAEMGVRTALWSPFVQPLFWQLK